QRRPAHELAGHPRPGRSVAARLVRRQWDRPGPHFKGAGLAVAVVVERTGESREHTVPPPHENHVRGQVAKQSRGRRTPHDATQDFSSAARRFMFAAPLLLITGFAVFGQIGYGVDHYTPPRADYTYKLAIAIGAAFAIESISNYVQWQAHRSRLAGATARA